MEETFQTEVSGKKIEINLKNWAEQAAGSCLVRMGDTEVLATAVMSKQDKPDQDFFPLTVDYEERFYAAGKIFGSRFIRRESRPTDEAILAGRMIDRAIRPRFPKEFKRETQVIATCLSWDGENDPDALAFIAASTALSISDIPFLGPVALVRIGRIEDQWIFNPTYEQRKQSDIDLSLSGVKANGELLINMIEMGAKEISEEDVMKATEAAYPEIKKLIELQEEVVRKVGKQKAVFPAVSDNELSKFVKDFTGKKLLDAVKKMEASEKGLSTVDELQESLVLALTEKYDKAKIMLGIEYFQEEAKKAIYNRIIEENIRPDGRKIDELRKITCEVGVLPRTHGTGIFSRGLTRVLSILTLGGPRDQQMLEGMEYVGKKRFMHHYNFPPYSSGEVSPMRGPKRREVGHGALVEKALTPLIPDFEQFPYTIRIVSEVVSSNGSTSMASVCASTLALLDAGVPIKSPAAGISIGIAEHSKTPKLMLDIQGPEDHLGGMDFKVAGTRSGITAIQMDTKTDGINRETMKEALEMAKKARFQILDIIKEKIAEPRQNLSPWAPKIKTMMIDPTKIGDVIGPRGSIINKLIEQYQVSIDIEDSGQVFITGLDDKAVEGVMLDIKALTREIEVGEIFNGEIKRITEFGAFVQILPGVDGLVHISKLVPYHIKSVQEVAKEGDIIPVKVISIDELGRINLSAIEAGFQPKKNDQPNPKR
ncbi:polyribonucleotide nucleotidyltransferase [Patescibacteria group bacterium]|nr:polyribonucleotide nucleotidyltransferase [Patescibacteria group bacterium]